MPSIRDKSTINAIAKAFVSNGRKQEQAMIDVGYSKAYAKSYCGKMWANPKIKAAIAKIDAKDAEKLDLSRESQHAKLKEAFDIAKAAKNAAAMTSAIREQNEMLGYHRDKAPNAEKEQARLERMSEEERRLAEVAAQIRTEQEAKTVPIRGSKTA